MTVAQDLTLDPRAPVTWTHHTPDEVFNVSAKQAAPAQLEALQLRFADLKDKIAALANLVEGEGIESIETLNDVLPLLFDHRVYKNYPISLIEKRNIKRLNAWLNKLTTHDLTKIPLDDVTTIDDWLTRLDEHGMIVGHSTGTTGKLSFIPRSRVEWPAFAAAYFVAVTAAIGFDQRYEKIHSIATGYRKGHQMMIKMTRLMAEASASGEVERDVLYDHGMSSDLLSLAGRFRAAEAKGELDQLEIDPELIERHRANMTAGAKHDDNLEEWFRPLAEKHKGKRVMVGGPSADLVRIALRGVEAGHKCEFSDDAVLMTGGGFKGWKGAPDDWQDLITTYFGIPKICSVYSMSEIMANCPKCSEGNYHLPAYLIPYVLDAEAKPLPREGSQTGRLALFDLLAETYWGGFISGDRVTLHWGDDCGCGWKSPRISGDIVRFAELEGGDDDKITCAGTQQAMNNFLDYVGGA
jgi:hypothetical protein